MTSKRWPLRSWLGESGHSVSNQDFKESQLGPLTVKTSSFLPINTDKQASVRGCHGALRDLGQFTRVESRLVGPMHASFRMCILHRDRPHIWPRFRDLSSRQRMTRAALTPNLVPGCSEDKAGTPSLAVPSARAPDRAPAPLQVA
jgi:hypothetical protein